MSRNFPCTLGDGIALAATTTSARVSVSAVPENLAADDVLIDNRGAVDAYVCAGGATVVATDLCVRVPAGQGVIFAKGRATHVAAKTASGTTSLVLPRGVIRQRTNGSYVQLVRQGAARVSGAQPKAWLLSRDGWPPRRCERDAHHQDPDPAGGRG